MAPGLNNLAQLLDTTGRRGEAEPLYRRALAILSHFARRNGRDHPHHHEVRLNYLGLLAETGLTEAEIEARIDSA